MAAFANRCYVLGGLFSRNLKNEQNEFRRLFKQKKVFELR
jgi:hypothetical protein